MIYAISVAGVIQTGSGWLLILEVDGIFVTVSEKLTVIIHTLLNHQILAPCTSVAKIFTALFSLLW
jgi:hypothetical protein